MSTLLYLDDYYGFGSKRRESIKLWFEAHPDGAIAVNNKYQPHTKFDRDLQKLIKIGFLRAVRKAKVGHCRRGMGWKKSGASQTYLVKA